ncbi:MAG: mechanosensitive ion channel [Holosporaceae bacterium]|jgi:small-conductance mechanosensitive channel|nr:mechanosensitive ion channel [Holosporaceae bacterium]
MNFVLNLANLLSEQEFCFLCVHLILGLAMAVSFSFAKKFMNSELNKLQSDEKIDRAIILVSGIVLSTLTVVIFIMCTGLALEYWWNRANVVCQSHFRLIIIFSILLTTSYAITTPYHPRLRVLNISDRDAILVYKKFLRVVVLSFIMTMIASFKPEWRYFFVGLTIIYYFSEMMASRDIINDIFAMKKMKGGSFSFQLTNYINGKLVFLCLAGMIVSVFMTHSTAERFFFESLKNIYRIVATIFFSQIAISKIIDKFVKQLDSVRQGIHSKLTASKRQKNLIWICDVMVIIFYLFIVCSVLKYIGISLGEHVFHEKTVTVSGIIFATILIYRGFHEFADILLEKAKDDANEENYKIKLETFLPTLSTIFYTILFATSSLLVLANLGINIAPILAAFTVFSAAIGLAAQDIIRSFLHGITFLIEKDLYIGAYVKINEKEGAIEKLAARVIYLRGDEGAIHIIPYSMVNTVTNYSQDYSCYCGSLYINAEDDIEKNSQILRDIVKNMKNEEDYRDVILGEVEIHGLKPFDLTKPQIYWKIKTSPSSQGLALKYEIYRRLYAEYKKQNISFPTANFIASSAK